MNSMDPDRWNLIESLYHSSADLEPGKRDEFLKASCAGDEHLYKSVKRLLDHQQEAEDFFSTTPLNAFEGTQTKSHKSLPGRQINTYRIISEIGRGGMGQVYQATDLKLERDVAIKVLIDEFSKNDDRVERFKQEAKILASLNHPNIAAIYGLEESDGTHFLAMELIEGKTLDQLINDGPVPLEKALKISLQIVEALKAAHAKGVIHRDLKPANIKVAADENVKVLDFGLAKAYLESSKDVRPTRSPSFSMVFSQQGTILCTPSYMSPEQANRQRMDPRSDIFSFGIIFYEMLTGFQPFRGSTYSETLNAINNFQVPPLRLSSGGENIKNVQHILDRCLAKMPDERYPAIQDLIDDLHTASQRLDKDALDEQPAFNLISKLLKKPVVAISAAMILIFVVTALALFSSRNQENGIRVGQSRQLTIAPGPELDPAISPDGKRVAYTSPVGNNMQIFVQDIAGGNPVNITELIPGKHRTPQWSLDGKQILFVTSLSDGTDRIHVIGNLGGIPQTLVEINETRFMPSLWGPTWSHDGKRIAYAMGNAIYTLSLEDGKPLKIADAFEPHSLSWSQDGEWIAFVSGNYSFVALGGIAPSSIEIVHASGGKPIRITDDKPALNVSPNWLPDSRSIIFVSNLGGNRDLYIAHINSSGSLKEDPLRLTTGLDAQSISVSNDGKSLLYSAFGMQSNLWAMPIPGKKQVFPSGAYPITLGNQVIEGLDISPDEKWIAFDSNRSGNQDIYKITRSGKDLKQLTDDPADDFLPNFSPDGKWLAFYSFRNGNRDLYTMSIDGTFKRQITDDPSQERYPHWSPDSKNLAFYSDKTGRNEIYIISKKESGNWGEPRQLTREGGVHPEWSSDGKWIAHFEEGNVMLISPEGGASKTLVDLQPSMNALFGAFSRDGNVLFFKANDRDFQNTIWSVPVSGGPPELLVQFDDPLRPSLRPEFAVDSHEIVFTVSERQSDIWMLELETVQ
ncbi:MAG: protein kinase [Acidobacteriota bacterium]